MSLRPFKEPNGGPSLELADVGWRGGCSYLQRLGELLTDQNMRHSFGGKKSSVETDTLATAQFQLWLIALFGLSRLLHALAVLRSFCPPQPYGQGSALLPSVQMEGRVAGRPGWIHTTQWYPEHYQNKLSLGSIKQLVLPLLWQKCSRQWSQGFLATRCCLLPLQLPTWCLYMLGPGPSYLPKPSYPSSHCVIF